MSETRHPRSLYFTEFLLSRLDEDEAFAEYLRGQDDELSKMAGERIHNSVYSKRAVLDEYRATSQSMWETRLHLEPVLKTFAQEYSHHPDYRKNWRDNTLAPMAED